MARRTNENSDSTLSLLCRPSRLNNYASVQLFGGRLSEEE